MLRPKATPDTMSVEQSFTPRRCCRARMESCKEGWEKGKIGAVNSNSEGVALRLAHRAGRFREDVGDTRDNFLEVLHGLKYYPNPCDVSPSTVLYRARTMADGR